MGYTEEAAGTLRNAATLLEPAALLAFATQLDQVQQLLALTGERYQNQFGPQIAQIQGMLRDGAPALHNIARDMTDAAAELQRY